MDLQGQASDRLIRPLRNLRRDDLDRSMLEYQLDTLTNRGQEGDFERFARRLAEREVCPNLLPHTGPTGGGDSKVDAETYPVADSLALAWYVGEGRQAASERWAFAFSAKKKWRPKVQSDVAKIVGTGRAYAKAFFVTNQYVPDKTRAEVEDALRKAHEVDVRILDRSWILERVYAGGHTSLAIEELRLQVSARTTIQKGPFDLRRESELTTVDGRIDEAVRTGRPGPMLVDDLTQSALLARGLERSRSEVEGRFTRARQAAEQHGTAHQRIVVAYQEAFGPFWWYEDFSAFLAKLEAFEQHLTGTDNVYHLELATSLWMALRMAVQVKALDAKTARLEERVAGLQERLDAIRGQQGRPSAALQAETLGLQIRLLLPPPEDLDDLLQALQRVIERSRGLVGFPLSALVESITEMGRLVGDRPAYEELHETAVAVVSERQGEVTAARLLLKRAAQHLDDDRPYDAIRSIGRALAKLFKHESRRDLVRALYLCGAAYEQVGLLWAARGSLLAAASVVTNEFWRAETVTPVQVACYDRLRWIELRLGRLPQTLAWHEVTLAVKHALAAQGVDPERLRRGDQDFDAILGMLLLRTDVWSLKWLSRLAATLEHLALPAASLALRFALGHEEEVAKDLEGEKDLLQFFASWADQPAAADLPAAPALYNQRTASLASRILGCRVDVDADSAPPCIELAESVLAALEGLLATGLLGSVFARTPSLPIRIRKGDFVAGPFEFAAEEPEGRPHVRVTVADWNAHTMSFEAQQELKARLAELLASLVALGFTMSEPEETLLALIRDERAMERALNFTGSFLTVANVLGDKPKFKLSEWLDHAGTEYRVKRAERWDAGVPAAGPAHVAIAADQAGQPSATAGPSTIDLSGVKHTDIEMVSLIRPSLWDQAGWTGTVFMTSPDDAELPCLAPMFRNEEVCRMIFRQWRRDLGEVDRGEQLRVSIVRGVSALNPHAYRVLIGSNPDQAFLRAGGKLVAVMSRINQMDPATSENLERFLASYRKHQGYFLLPAVVQRDGRPPEPLFDHAIAKRELLIRHAWAIGEHDLDAVAISEADSPVIPDNKEADAPVLALLERLRTSR